MKELFIIRHAKSSWDDSSLSDFERPLNKRGKRDAPLMGKVLKEQGYLPDLMISSTANRALTTAGIIREELGFSKELVKAPEIYEASASTLLNLINTFDNSKNRVFIFGHNPGFTYLAEKLSDEHFGNIPTCGIVGIRFELDDWQLISAGIGSDFYYDYPKRHL